MITTSQKRATLLWQTISRLTTSIFWITNFEEMEKSSWLCQRIWFKAGQEGNYALLE